MSSETHDSRECEADQNEASTEGQSKETKDGQNKRGKT